MKLVTVTQLVQRHPGFTPGGVRWWLSHARRNGLAEAGAVVRSAKRIYLDEEKFLCWIKNRRTALDYRVSTGGKGGTK